MSFFRDKTYEDLDWLNTVIDVPVFSLNDKLASLQDTYEITFDHLLLYSSLRNSAFTNVHELLEHIVSKSDVKFSITDLILLDTCFSVQITPDTIIDYGKKTLSNPLFLNKHVQSFSEQQIKNQLCSLVRETYPISIQYDKKHVHAIMSVIDCNTSLNSHKRTKIAHIESRLLNIIAGNLWNIKNFDLYIKVIDWIISHLSTGNLAAIANLTKLKCMTHSGKPIHSMEEVI